MKFLVFSLILIAGVWNIADCNNEYKSQQPHIIRAESIGAYLQTSRSGYVPMEVSSWIPVVKNTSAVSPDPKQEPVTRQTLGVGTSVTTPPAGHNFNSRRQQFVASSRTSGPLPTQNSPKQVQPKDATTTVQPPRRPPAKIQVSSQPYAYRKATVRPYSSSTTVVPTLKVKVNYVGNKTSPTDSASFLPPQRYRPDPEPKTEKSPPLIAPSQLPSPPIPPRDHAMAYADGYQSNNPNYQSNYFQNTASREYVFPLVTTTKKPPINPLQALAPLFSGILGHTADHRGLTVLANDYYKKNNLTEPKQLIKYVTHLEGDRAPAEPKVTEVPILVRTHAPPPPHGSYAVNRPIQPQASYLSESYVPNLPKAPRQQYPSNDFSGSFHSPEGTRYNEERLVARHVPGYQSQMISAEQQNGYHHVMTKKNTDTELLQQLMEQFQQNKAEEGRHRQFHQDESHVRQSNYPTHEYREQVVPYMDKKIENEQHASVRYYAPQGDHRVSIHYVHSAPVAPEPNPRLEMPHLPKPGSEDFDEDLFKKAFLTELFKELQGQIK